MKRKVSCSNYLFEITLLELPNIVKAASEAWPYLRLKVNSTRAESFPQEPCLEMDVMLNVNFGLSGNNMDQRRGFYNDLNQNVITAINTLDGSTLRDNLITNPQIDYVSSALISAETVENNQEHLVANKVAR